MHLPACVYVHADQGIWSTPECHPFFSLYTARSSCEYYRQVFLG